MRTLPKQVIRCSASCTHFQISSFHFNNRGWVEQGYIIQAEDFTSVALQRRLLRSNTFEMNEALKKAMQKPLVVGGIMPAEVETEVLDIVTAAVDKWISTENYEKAAQTAKEGLDRKFGACWHCVIGEGFGYQVTYQSKNTLFCYYAEKLGVLVWKA